MHVYIFNSSPPSIEYICQGTGPALVQVMVCRLFDVKPLPEPTLIYCQSDPSEQTSVKFISTKLFIHENALENVICQMAAILSTGRWIYKIVKPYIYNASNSDTF